MKYLAIAATALALSAGAASAATITETTDFGDFFFPTSAGEFALGSHTISGGLSTTCVATTSLFADCSSGDQIDSISFSLAADTEISNLVLTITDYSATGTLGGVEQLGLGRLGFFRFDSDGVFTVTNITDAHLFSQFTFEAITSTVTSVTPNLQGTGDISYNYSASFDVVSSVSPVPLPAGFPLLAVGLIGFGALARRKKPA